VTRGPDPEPIILLVEDERDVLDSLTGLLEHEVDGVRVIAAADAAQALRRVDDAPRIAVAIADYRLPGQDGAAFLTGIGAAHPEARRILISAFPEIGDVPDTVADAFIQKPMDPDEFLDIVHALLHAARAGMSVTRRARRPARRPSAV
jgi:DNA-binding NtrC family response regulator